MGHRDVFQISIRKNRKWKVLPYLCSSHAQINGILARYTNVEYKVSVNGMTVKHWKPKMGFIGKMDQAGIPTLGKKKR